MTTLLFILYCIPIISLICLICAAYAYAVNARRADTDPEKRDYDPAAIFLAPFTWPFFAIVRILLFIVVLITDLIVFTFILLLFILMVLFRRKPIILEWLQKVMLKVGNKLLEANTFLLRGFLGRTASPAAP
jgi:hypothetical protein